MVMCGLKEAVEIYFKIRVDSDIYGTLATIVELK
jgi:hypothetical protein